MPTKCLLIILAATHLFTSIHGEKPGTEGGGGQLNSFDDPKPIAKRQSGDFRYSQPNHLGPSRGSGSSYYVKTKLTSDRHSPPFPANSYGDRDYEYRRDRVDPYHPSSSYIQSHRRNSNNYYDGDYYGRDRPHQHYYDDYERYQRDREYIMRNGQLRHAQYQKRIGQSGQEYYDPFYFIGVRKGAGPQPLAPGTTPGTGSAATVGTSPSAPSSTLPQNSSPGNQLSSAASSNSAAVAASPAPLRNRRNSQQYPSDLFNDIDGGGKYDIMTAKSAYPPVSHHDERHRNRWQQHNQHLDRQFLTREQLVRQHPDMRVPYPLDKIDRGRYNRPITSASGRPWSVRIGTQLKVNDDGRSPNPDRFYVRDETGARSRSASRFPIYRRRK